MAVSAELRQLRGRIAAQERMSNMLLARVEELSEDIQTSFKQQVEEQVRFEQHLDARLGEVNTRIDVVRNEMNARFDGVNARFADVNARFDEVKAEMGAMERRILDAFAQLVTMMGNRLPPQH